MESNKRKVELQRGKGEKDFSLRNLVSTIEVSGLLAASKEASLEIHYPG